MKKVKVKRLVATEERKADGTLKSKRPTNFKNAEYAIVEIEMINKNK